MHLKEEKIINKPISQVYELISNVENYPDFIPLITNVELLKSYENIKEYEITVSFQIFKEKFSTKDIFYKNKKIEIHLISGPFKHLHNVWIFEYIDDNTTKIIFEINFEFKSLILSKAFTSIFTLSQKKIFSYFLNQLK